VVVAVPRATCAEDRTEDASGDERDEPQRLMRFVVKVDAPRQVERFSAALCTGDVGNLLTISHCIDY